MSWPSLPLPRDKRPVQSAEGDKHEWISDPHYTRHGPVITPIRQIPNHHFGSLSAQVAHPVGATSSLFYFLRLPPKMNRLFAWARA